MENILRYAREIAERDTFAPVLVGFRVVATPEELRGKGAWALEVYTSAPEDYRLQHFRSTGCVSSTVFDPQPNPYSEGGALAAIEAELSVHYAAEGVASLAERT